MNPTIVSRRIQVRGTVQGVGFRPFVHRLASRHGLRGWVKNHSTHVEVFVEGSPDGLETFLESLTSEAPPLARIDAVHVRAGKPAACRRFEILPSLASPCDSQPVPVDTATCNDCLRELFDPGDRRYRYPFINCTNCGPRLTIIDSMPYDRVRTTMSGFEMCSECEREYRDPADRRFHAQPNACATCGPRVNVVDASGATIDVGEPIAFAAERLRERAIVAIKGLGGYHLAVDARSEPAVARLRWRKHREEKPLALMAGDLSTIRRLCELNRFEEALLTSRRCPIVLLRSRGDRQVAPSVAPGRRDLGLMLPYTPLHHLLFSELEALGVCAPLLVLTSGNTTDEPIAYEDGDALERLGSIADFFLIHDRPIRSRCDDSVTRWVDGSEVLLRRSRSYAPDPIKVPFEFREPVLACGAHLKNTFCLGKERHALLSPHVGDLNSWSTLQSLVEGIDHHTRLFDTTPTVVACDLHPEYLATKYARDLHGARLVGVQHHHAHIASVLAEHGLTGPVIGVAFDGTGFGTDGRIWGAEFLVADYDRAIRVAHLDYVPLPGGEQAIVEPWRLAVTYLDRAFGADSSKIDLPLTRALDHRRWSVLRRMIQSEVNCPLASSMGRLFDAVCALATGRERIAYEGQAAVELEMLADLQAEGAYEFSLSAGNPIVVRAEPVIRGVVRDLLDEVPVTTVAGRFHNAVASLVVRVCRVLRAHHRLGEVALSGGVFQNALLLSQTLARLRGDGFEVYTNSRVPPNDGGLSLGQAAVAAARMGAGSCV